MGLEPRFGLFRLLFRKECGVKSRILHLGIQGGNLCLGSPLRIALCTRVIHTEIGKVLRIRLQGFRFPDKKLFAVCHGDHRQL